MTESAPAWAPANASERAKRRWESQMLRWLSEQLDEQNTQNVIDATALDVADDLSFEKMCIALARVGRPESLRKLYPQFADCIHSPKRRGHRPWKHPKSDIAKIAAEFVPRIRALWL